MIFNDHSKLKDQHAFLGASKHSWINYSEDKLTETYLNHLAVQRGTELHAFAAEAIRLGIKLPKSRKTLNMYVNDAIGFKMSPEVILYYSENCFGTADTIAFRKNVLRVHDLKTGETKASMHQLEVYDAIFCLEYGKDPRKIEIENRIYQYDDVFIENPDKEFILYIMGKIVASDKRIEELKIGGW